MNMQVPGDWLKATFPHVSRETWGLLGRYEALVGNENDKQNLVSKSTLANFTSRHVVDSAQLLLLAPEPGKEWLDVGSGAGLPGIILALLSSHRVTLVESRRLRIEFLHHVVGELCLADRVTIVGSDVRQMNPRAFDVVTARAFAPLPKLLALTHPFSRADTVWVLPKGRSAELEMAQARPAWQGEFRLVPSVTDEDARIIVAHGIRPRAKS